MFLSFQVNLEYLESKLECLDGEEVQQIQENVNSLFHHCVQAMGEEHQIKVVNALQVRNPNLYTTHTSAPIHTLTTHRYVCECVLSSLRPNSCIHSHSGFQGHHYQGVSDLPPTSM